ncbi:MAG: tRNA pseudouridine(38-40) synthase TruA [Brevinema sp.]
MGEKVTYKLTLAYEGSAFKGWHTQTEFSSVQTTLNNVLSALYKRKIFCWGAGRTDSGAHALNYTAHFRTHDDLIPRDKIVQVLNGKLPPTIRIYQAELVDNNFHATFSCTGRMYCYFIWTGEVLPPRFYQKAYHEMMPLDLELLKKTVKKFWGTRDFAQFCYGYSATERAKKTTIRRLDYVRVKIYDDHMIFFIKGEGFLRGMIRTLIGTSLSVAKGIMTLEDIDRSLDGAPLPNHLWKPVPADGLYFKRAFYQQTK